MNRKRQERLKFNKINETGANQAPVLSFMKAAVAPRDSDGPRRMLSKPPASSPANHARHNVSRRQQS